MARNITTTGQLPPAVDEYFCRAILLTAYPDLHFQRFAMVQSIPEGSGSTIVFRRYPRLAPATIPLKNGITPAGSQLSVEDIKATIEFYGNYVTLDNDVLLTVEDDTLNQASRILAMNSAESLNIVTRDVLASTASTYLCQGGQNAKNPSDVSAEDLNNVIHSLIGQDCYPIKEVITATDQYATTPIREAYIGIVHTDILQDLEALAGFVKTNQYAGDPRDTIMSGEYGAFNQIRFLKTTIGSKYIDVNGDSVYNNFVFGREAYAAVHLGNKSGEFYVKPRGSEGSADPLNQRASVGFGWYYACTILNSNFIENVKCTLKAA